MGDRPSAAPGQDVGDKGELNVLVMGSDTRKDNAAEGSDTFGLPRSDTTIVLHLAQGRKSAVAVSIPRDSVVDLPTCIRPDGTTIPARPHRMFNEAFNDGAACTYRTVEQLTGLRIDHYVVVDFKGFKSMVNALGGVTVCLPKRVDDKLALLHLDAGRQVVKGDQALAYVRERHKLGDGSDLGRIGRQQSFLSSMIQKATSTGTLTNPTKLIPFLDAATSSLTTDPGFASLNTMRRFAQSIQALPTQDITFLTVPNEAYVLDDQRVQWKQPEADDVWRAMREDTPVPGTRAYTLAHAGDPKLTVRPADITVRLSNSSGISGLGTRTAEALRSQGFHVVEAPSDGPAARTTITHSAGTSAAAATLAEAIKPSVDAATGEGSSLRLVLGSDFLGTEVIPTSRFPDLPPEEGHPPPRTADQDICT